MRKLLLFISVFLCFSCSKEDEPSSSIDLSGIEIVAHKGGNSSIYPENSLEVIQHSLDINVDGIEIDIRLTKDKQIVLLHDESVDRTTTGTGKIKDFTFEETQQLYLKNSKGEVTDQQIPTLYDVIELIDGQANLYIEIKDYSDFLIYRLLSYIKEHDLESWVRIISYGKTSLFKIHTQSPNILVGNIVFSETGRIEFRSNNDSFINFLFVDYRALDRANSTELSKIKKRIFVYTVDKVDDISKDNYLLIDGIVSDDPRYWLKLRNKKQ